MFNMEFRFAISALPLERDLLLARRVGVDTLINVSGSPSGILYEGAMKEGLTAWDYWFTDVFSGAVDQSSNWRTQIGEDGYHALLNAVSKTVECLRQRRFTYVVCSLGRARSALVLGIALQIAHDLPAEEARALVRRVRPQCEFRPRAILAWDVILADLEDRDCGVVPGD